MQIDLNILSLLESQKKILPYYYKDEKTVVEEIIANLNISQNTQSNIQELAYKITKDLRLNRKEDLKGFKAILHQYDISEQEGIILMCLAESLLRIPDSATVDDLIKDKISSTKWHINNDEDSWIANATSWGLLITGTITALPEKKWYNTLNKVTKQLSLPFIRVICKKLIETLAYEFITGEDIEKAIQNSQKNEALGFLYSYDMLGEAAINFQQGEKYFEEYLNAINAIGKNNNPQKTCYQSPGISVKLTALHPRYELHKIDSLNNQLIPKLTILFKEAKKHNISIFIDAEEAERLSISLYIIEKLLQNPHLQGNWQGFGVVVQAYNKRAFRVIEWLGDLAKKYKQKIMVRLVKGAYWDTEIKIAQENVFSNYPVFTRKAYTDICYIYCIQKLLQYQDYIYPCFATHNAHTLSCINILGENKEYELQKLHGMGDFMYSKVIQKYTDKNCRIYAPVGNYKTLLPYLVRRLLENGANSSFVNRLYDNQKTIEELIDNPINISKQFKGTSHPQLNLPKNIFTKSKRKLTQSINIDNELELQTLIEEINNSISVFNIYNQPFTNKNKTADLYSPIDQTKKVGSLNLSDAQNALDALEVASKEFNTWGNTDNTKNRIKIIQEAAKLFKENQAKLINLLIKEAGKTLKDSIAEVKEAVDFLNYYAHQAKIISKPNKLETYCGEVNYLQLHPRGVFLCISPWNFPLAITIGQISAALVMGNTVLAKPALSTSLIAHFAISLLHKAGVPKNALILLIGSGREIASLILKNPKLSGIALTGSTETALDINKNLANNRDDIIPIIAETGGINAMIVDSSALIEQVIKDVITSSFQSAGQRCSACRILLIQEEIAEDLIFHLKNAIDCLEIGDPHNLSTDIGPVIDKKALDTLQDYKNYMILNSNAKLIGETNIKLTNNNGYFFAPTIYEVNDLDTITKEVFGPILHIYRYKYKDLDKVIDKINNKGFGLTHAIHSRIATRYQYISSKIQCGNIYINRNQIGALVGIQPFGGEKKSGTGFKAGGPHYLLKFALERTYSINTTAIGGNTALMLLS